MKRPINIHPDLWKKKYNNGEQIKPLKIQKKEIELDDFTKINNSVDLMVQALNIFKETYQNMDLQEYTELETNGLKTIDNLISCGLIPYTIDIVKTLNNITIEEKDE